jgi:hypothetical protein
VSWQAVGIVVLAVAVVGAVMRGWTWWLRERAVRSVPADQIRRAARGVSLRVMVRGSHALPGMNPARANRTRGDLILTDDRFVLASGRGTLADLRAGAGRRFTSARTTGPGRLVIEGDRPGPHGEPGLFRVEIFHPDAEAWAIALRPFVEAAPDAPPYASAPKPISSS